MSVHNARLGMVWKGPTQQWPASIGLHVSLEFYYYSLVSAMYRDIAAPLS